VLVSKTVMMKWHTTNKDWYEDRKYIYTKYKDEFEVRVEDLPDGSNIKVDIKCDECGEIVKNIIWNNYIVRIKRNMGKYYCRKCTQSLISGEKQTKTKVKNGNSFEQWCINNLSAENAHRILIKWDYDMNIDKYGNNLKPSDVNYCSKGLNGKGYWFKCLDHPEHKSEQKNIQSLTQCKEVDIKCSQCNIISITHPHLVNYFVNIEDTLKYSAGSHETALVKCLRCGQEKEMSIHTLTRAGIGCIKCGDGVSYPEKFMFGVLEQLLNKNFKTQLSKKAFKWCGKYKYDFYLDKINCIIETHGEQHYKEKNKVNGKWESLSEVQENDKQKEILAKANGIENYIIIDCRKSELEWIKNSIMQSELPNLLKFNEHDIDWLKCHEFGCNSLVKVVCDLWNSGINSASEIAEKLKRSVSLVSKYLKQGVKLGWCDYNVNKQRTHNNKIICLNTLEIFDTQIDASKKYNCCNISACCRNSGNVKSSGKHPETGEPLVWMYYDKYLLKTNQQIADILKQGQIIHRFSKKVICITTGEIFISFADASRKYNIQDTSIIRNCKTPQRFAGKHPETGEKLIWMYYDEYLKTKEGENN